MNLTQWITLGATPAALIGIIIFLYRLRRDLHKDIDELRKAVHGVDARLVRVEGMMQSLLVRQS